MSKLSKVIVTILVLVVFVVLFAVITGMRESAGHSTPGILGIIVFVAMIGALRAVWKKDNKNNDSNMLQK